MEHPFIITAEEKYGKLLREKCTQIFSGTDMPSHDHLHHDRVWKNAASLISRLADAGLITDENLAVKAIIASFFHDTGLTVNRGPDHGIESRHICSAFLETTGLTEEERHEILDAIEKHDNKEYTGNSDPCSLAAIISVADDMDAFGEAGIGRYEEIYSMRGIPAPEMPGLIVTNVLSRLRHLESTYKMFPDLIADMRVRAEKVTNHFTNRT